jgi:hypothetical protein
MLGLALQSAAPLATASCDGHECDPHWVDYGCPESNVAPSEACCDQGCMIDDDTWASTPQNAGWLPFLSYEQLRLHLGAWVKGRGVPEQGFSSILIAPAAPPDAPFPDADPTDATVDETTVASGNLGEFVKIGSDLVIVENATCSAQLVRVIIGFPKVEGGVTSAMKGPCQKSAKARCDAR